ncbi:hypothetical protein [Nocardiopsis potens]|uniref:hypothetical protein n=1 Tax=Nocardiopsis potens TaxID=1246458 RepID=UPI00034A509D|nr:hypothetical protein [Nocardiopsis potens]
MSAEADDRAARERNLVEEWHRAVNERDGDAARRVAAPDIEVGGPQGGARGVGVLLDWIDRAGIRLDARAWHHVFPGVLVVEQDASWPGRADAGPSAPAVRTATLFTLAGDRITAALRHDDGLHAALEAARDRAPS